MGAIRIVSSCQICRGFGKEIVGLCNKCSGKGRKKVVQNVSLNIPAGIGHGSELTPENNLNIIILYKPHKDFNLLENMMDVQNATTIDIFKALLGGSVKVKTIDGEKSLKIKPTCQPGTVMRIKGAGMRNRRNQHGDHLVVVNVKLPDELTVEQKSLLKKLDTTLKGGKDGKTKEK
jgi:molecular chaperone DnaJ